ncbi:unnamed protein product [Kluyveromyces dobzhanskii CBS 2104]|uniref:peptidylprolyl isomerase n=1 Tax=Kluyveromyces dobzhanskii CBS 2104 TaxID=1427455 RepID=A0A0A8LA54_9SACH|nr:unnamed protein product [Kluyveromyces dobzhanskii CBS 2104]
MSKVYLDIKIGDEPIGRIVCELFETEAPKTCANFLQLCKGGVFIDGRELSYKNNKFHRVIKNFMIQAGDLMFGSGDQTNNEEIGRGGCSIYATEDELKNSSSSGIQCFGNFEDENLGDFTESFMLAMANTGSENTNSSQFFITTYPSPHLNGKHSKFGRVVAGKSVVRTVEHSGVDENGVPHNPIIIEDCGEWTNDMGIPLYNACNDTIGNDIYEENPDDDTNFGDEDFAKAYDAAETIKQSGSLLFKNRDFKNALFKYKKALKYTTTFTPELDVDKEYNEKFASQKIKLYLNICLMQFYLKDYHEAIKYSTFVVDADCAPDSDRAKAHFRRGNCYSGLNRSEAALLDYKKCKELSPEDKNAEYKIEITEKKIASDLERTKKNVSKFFQ